MKPYVGSRDLSPLILNLDSRCRHRAIQAQAAGWDPELFSTFGRRQILLHLQGNSGRKTCDQSVVRV